jgi:signal transduction histidine kinase
VQIKRLFATTSFRLASLYAALMIGAFALAAIIAWFATLDAGRRELEQRINAEVAALTHEYAAEGLEPAVLAINSRAEHPGALEYRLSDEQGHVRVGDLPAPRQTGWSIVDGGREEGRLEQERLLIFSARLPDGAMLSVGDDLDRGERIRGLLLSVLAWTGLAALVLGLALSVLVTRRSLRRIDQIISVARNVSAGHLDARTPVRRGQPTDDLDELGAAFNAMLDRIETLIASVRQVSTDVAHDLRTPLSHMRQRLDRLRAAGLSDEARNDVVDSLDAKIEEIVRTFDAMLRLAELDSNQAPPPMENVDLAQTVERLADAFRLDIEGAGRSLDLALEHAWVAANSELLTQLVANLLDNAARHTPPGTRIVISTREEGAHSVLIVADNGPGVPAPERDAVIQRFYRLERSRTSAGSGLGLSIAAAIARIHHAELALEDAKPGLCARVTFDRKG